MNFNKVGKSGLKLSAITYGSALTIGTETDDLNTAQKLIDQAWELGIRSFDTSNNYGNGQAETLIASALTKYPREQYVIATKGSWPIGDSVYHSGLSRKHIVWALEQSLKRMKLEYVDIYYAHRYDPSTPMEEIVRTYNQMIEQRKILYWATSEWPLDALIECHTVCERLGMEKPILEQFIYSYAIDKSNRNGVKEFCIQNGVGMLGFSPLAQGLLTGKYQNGIPNESRIAKSSEIGYDKTLKIYEQTKKEVDYFCKVCTDYNVKMSHAAIQWVLRNGVFPVLGASRPEQLSENVEALEAEFPEAFWIDLNKIKDCR